MIDHATHACVVLIAHPDARRVETARLLVVTNRAAGGFSLPGGKCEPGDATLWHAAARELREEVGLDLPLGRLVFQFMRPGSADPLKRVHVFTVAGELPCEPTAREAGTSVAWLTLEEIAAQDTPLAPFYADHAAAFYRAIKIKDVI